jgi:hypothetical protein
MEFQFFNCVRNRIHPRREHGTSFVPCVFKGCKGKRLLGRKMTIKASFLQAGCLHNILHGAALEAFAIEEGSRFRYDPIPGFRSFTHIVLTLAANYCSVT